MGMVVLVISRTTMGEGRDKGSTRSNLLFSPPLRQRQTDISLNHDQERSTELSMRSKHNTPLRLPALLFFSFTTRLMSMGARIRAAHSPTKSSPAFPRFPSRDGSDQSRSAQTRYVFFFFFLGVVLDGHR